MVQSSIKVIISSWLSNHEQYKGKVNELIHMNSEYSLKKFYNLEALKILKIDET